MKGSANSSSRLVQQTAQATPFTLIRGRGQFSDLDSVLRSGAKNFGRFVEEAFSQIRLFRELKAARFQVAHGVADSLRLLLQLETGSPVLEQGFPHLFHQLWGGQDEIAAFLQLWHWASIELQVPSLGRGERIAEEKLAELELLLRWYSKRKLSLIMMEEELNQSEEEQDSFFGFRIVPGAVTQSMTGISIKTGARLVSHGAEPIWFKVFFKQGRRFIASRGGWVGRYPGTHKGSGTELAGLYPCTPAAHRQIFDELQLFVPYQAFAVEAGLQTFEVISMLTTSAGEPLLTHEDVLTLPFSPQGADRALEELAPQAISLWSVDGRGEGTISSWTVSDAGVNDYGSAQPEAMIAINVDGDLRGLSQKYCRLSATLLVAGEQQAVSSQLIIPPTTLFSFKALPLRIMVSRDQYEAWRLSASTMVVELVIAEVPEPDFQDLKDGRVLCGAREQLQ